MRKVLSRAFTHYSLRITRQAMRRLTPASMFAFALWLLAAVAVTLLGLRVGMHALGVRDDVPLPGLVYRVTEPPVSSFYRFFPSDLRLDYHGFEVAALAAAGAVAGVALLVYVAALAAITTVASRRA